MGFDMDGLRDHVQDGLEKVQEKFEEVKNAEETQKFVKNAKEKAGNFGEKALDFGIDIGLKTAEVADELAGRAVESLKRASAKRAADKAAKEAGEDVVCDVEAKDVTED